MEYQTQNLLLSLHESARWGRETPEEEQSNRADSYNRIKTKFLHDSFVMYEIQYGINLDEFVKGIDPLKTFRLTKDLTQPEMINTTSKLKSRDLHSLAHREAIKYRAQVAVMNSCMGEVEVANTTARNTEARLSVYISNKGDELPVVIDTGASFCLSPVLADFVTPLTPVESTITGLSAEVAIHGKGTIEWYI